MGGKTGVKCRRCGKKVEQEGIRAEAKGKVQVLCAPCFGSIFPEGRDMPAAMDKDGNLYFTDQARNCMIIFFAYGEVPYSSCTEVSLEEEDPCGCGFGLM